MARAITVIVPNKNNARTPTIERRNKEQSFGNVLSSQDL
jgi:hypothetical protein